MKLFSYIRSLTVFFINYCRKVQKLSSLQLKSMFWKWLRECSYCLWSFCSDHFFPIENEWVKDTTNLDQHFSNRWVIFCCCSDFFFLFAFLGNIKQSVAAISCCPWKSFCVPYCLLTMKRDCFSGYSNHQGM